MESHIGKVRLHYVERGDGLPLVALHGAGVDHRDIAGALEGGGGFEGVRRIYVDLPGLGRSSADGLAGNDDVVTVLFDFLAQLQAGPVMLIGHSYGAYLARGVAGRRPDLVGGLALLAPIGERTSEVPPGVVIEQDDDAYDELDPEQRRVFAEYFVVRTAATARRFRNASWPGTRLIDQPAMERILQHWAVELGTSPFAKPTLIVAGRNDSTVGYRDAMALLDHYPHATLAVVAGAGHALAHERAELVSALIREWMSRVRASA